MTWFQRYHVRRNVANPIWISPLPSMVAAIGALPFFHGIEEAIGWESDPTSGTAGGVQLASFQPAPRILVLDRFLDRSARLPIQKHFHLPVLADLARRDRRGATNSGDYRARELN
ncbi:MAG: hypothetical protein RKP20_07280 [Candidatus Competibacter sp.]|nr:hypothetical protein [Candidatus Competibacter sp.]